MPLGKTTTQEATDYLKGLGYGSPDSLEIQGAKEELDPLVDKVNSLSSSVSGLMASSRSARMDYGQNSAKLDGKISKVTGGMYTDPNTGIKYNGVGPDGKPLQDPNQQIGPDGKPIVNTPLGTAADFAKTHDINNPENKAIYEAMIAKEKGTQGNGVVATNDPYSKMLMDASSQRDSQLSEAKTFYEDFKTRQDATTAAIIDSITKKYEARRAKMEDVNKRMLEGKRIAGISAGRMRYAPGMEEGLLSTEEMDGQARLAELDAQELDLVARAKQARDDASYKAFSDYMSQLDKVNDDKMNTITNLHKIAMDAEKSLADKKKAELDEQGKQTDLYIKNADNAAGAAYEQYNLLKTQAEKDVFLKEAAKRLNTTPDFLLTSMQEWETKNSNIESQISARESAATTREAQLGLQEQRIALEGERVAIAKEKAASGDSGKTNTDGSLKYTDNEVEQAKTLLQNGGSLDGVKYNPAGSNDGFVDPYAYKALYDRWILGGGTKAGFLKLFPPKTYVNPEATNLPTFLMPQ